MGNDVSASLANPEVCRRHCALIYAICNDTDARVPPGLTRKDVAQSRPVIDDDQLEIAVALSDDALDRSIEKP